MFCVWRICSFNLYAQERGKELCGESCLRPARGQGEDEDSLLG